MEAQLKPIKVKSKKIEWEAFDHIKVEKSADWYWIVSIIAIAGTVLSIYFDNLLLAVLILIGTFAIFVQNKIEPKMTSYEINRRGIRSGDTMYLFSSLDSFYVIDEDGWDRDRLILKSSKLFMPLITIPLGEDSSPDAIRDYLLEYLDEEQIEESLIEKIALVCGF